jgi:Glycosyltransferase family 92
VSSNEHDGARVYLAACLIYRDAATYLVEWLEFHRLMGVERFFLYDNESEDDHLEVLAPYIEDGTVVPHPWPGTAVQVAAYDHCIAAHRDEARWIAFIDIDEFLFSPTGEPLTKILPRYESAPGIGVNWVNFGTSGHQRRPAGLVIDNYVHQMRNPLARRTIKSIVNPAETLHVGSCHHFIYRDGFAVDDCMRPIRGPDFARTDPVPRRWLRINHYVSRSEEDLEQKRAMPRADTGATRTGRGKPAYGDVRDETIKIFAPAVRKAVAAAETRIERRRAR